MAHALTILVAVIHVLSAAGWVGAMGYSLLVVQPRAAAFFADQPDSDDPLERFVCALARRQRWPVLTALAVLAVTGGALTITSRPRPTSATWACAVAAQSICWVIALALFGRVSWHMWPARVFALPSERPAWRRRFRRVGLALLSLAVTASVAGVVASFTR